MNSAQVTSIVKAGANFVAGILTTHGAAKAASIVNAEDTIGVLVFIAIWVYSHFFQHTDEKEATPTPLPDSKGGGTLPPVVALLFICASLFLLPGCSKDNHRLELGGSYAPATSLTTTNDSGVISTSLTPASAPDFALYSADSTFELAYSALNAAFKIERDNRAFLWKLSPDIKHSLDNIRPDATIAVMTYTRARAEYELHPTPVNLSSMQSALALVQKLASAAAAVTYPATIKQ
jgi:hypothetical protein